jgi:membrane-bound ClpP family serine protease
MNQHKTAIRYGLIWSAISIATSLLLYLLGMMENTAAGILLFLLGIYIMYRSGADKRAEMGGFISWKEALTPTWLCSVIATFFNSLFAFILIKFIDPSLQDKQREQAIQITEKMRGLIGDSATEKRLEELEQQNFGNASNYIYMFLGGILLYFLIACLISLALKRKRAEDIFTKY